MTTVGTSKNIWRSKMLQARSELGPEKTRLLSAKLCKNLSFIWSEAPGMKEGVRSLWAGYKSFSWEADPAQAILEAAPYISWAYPLALDDLSLEFYVPVEAGHALAPGGTKWSKNAWGIWEPDPQTAEKIDLKKCLGVLVPGVAFDRRGYRLGYGKGFYDRALADYQGLKVGVGFSMQVTIGLPSETSDVRMDLIVTDEEIIRIPPEGVRRIS